MHIWGLPVISSLENGNRCHCLSHVASFMITTAENILPEFKEVLSRTGITLHLYKVVTHNASNVRKAFSESLPGLVVEQGDNQ